MCTTRTWKKYEREEEGEKREEGNASDGESVEQREGLPGVCKPPASPASQALSKVAQWLPGDVKEQGIL